MKFEIGNRVILNNGDKAIVIKPPTPYDVKTNKEILERYGKNNRYFIRLIHRLNVSGVNVTTWVSVDNLLLDKQWYRDIKLKKLL